MSYTISIVNGDFDYDQHGRVRTVSGTNKGAQDLGEMLQSRFDRKRAYGTLLDVGTVGAIDQSNWIRSELTSTVTRFQQLQQRAGVTDPSERVTGIYAINVTHDGRGAYTWNLQVTVGTGRLVSSYNGVLGRRLTSLLRSSPATMSTTTSTTPSLSTDETVEQAQARIVDSAKWGQALPGFVWKSPELPIAGAYITAYITPADEFAPTSITITPIIPATPKPVNRVSYSIDGVEVASSSAAPYIVSLPNIQAGTTTIRIQAIAVDTSVVGGGTAQITMAAYPTDRVWYGGKGAIDPNDYKFKTAWPFKDGNGIGEFPSGGKGAIDPNDYKFRDGTYAKE